MIPTTIRVRDNVVLNESQELMLKRVGDYELPYLEQRLLSNGWSRRRCAVALAEFRKFIALTGFVEPPLAMVGECVDEVWHELILFTPQYRRFCFETVGKFISHQPNTPLTPIPVEAIANFASAYNVYFGLLPNIWLEGDARASNWLSGIPGSKPPMRWSGWTGDE